MSWQNYSIWQNNEAKCLCITTDWHLLRQWPTVIHVLNIGYNEWATVIHVLNIGYNEWATVIHVLNIGYNEWATVIHVLNIGYNEWATVIHLLNIGYNADWRYSGFTHLNYKLKNLYRTFKDFFLSFSRGI